MFASAPRYRPSAPTPSDQDRYLMIMPTQSSYHNFLSLPLGQMRSRSANSMLGLQTTAASLLLVPQIKPRDTPLVCKTFTHRHNLSPRPPMAAARPLLKIPIVEPAARHGCSFPRFRPLGVFGRRPRRKTLWPALRRPASENLQKSGH